jgi:hypothetical protein
MWNTPLGFNVKENPLKDSPFVQKDYTGDTTPVGDNYFLELEGPIFELLSGEAMLLL